jgi:hypothetical protein
MDVIQLDAILQTLTPHQIHLIQALYSAGGKWLTRSRLARAINKKRLTPYDINCLAMLDEKGIIVQSTRPTNAPGSDFAYIYCMTEDIAVLLQAWADYRDQVYRSQRPPLPVLEDAASRRGRGIRILPLQAASPGEQS